MSNNLEKNNQIETHQNSPDNNNDTQENRKREAEIASERNRDARAESVKTQTALATEGLKAQVNTKKVPKMTDYEKINWLNSLKESKLTLAREAMKSFDSLIESIENPQIKSVIEANSAEYIKKCNKNIAKLEKANSPEEIKEAVKEIMRTAEEIYTMALKADYKQEYISSDMLETLEKIYRLTAKESSYIWFNMEDFIKRETTQRIKMEETNLLEQNRQWYSKRFVDEMFGDASEFVPEWVKSGVQKVINFFMNSIPEWFWKFMWFLGLDFLPTAPEELTQEEKDKIKEEVESNMRFEYWTEKSRKKTKELEKDIKNSKEEIKQIWQHKLYYKENTSEIWNAYSFQINEREELERIEINWYEYELADSQEYNIREETTIDWKKEYVLYRKSDWRIIDSLFNIVDDAIRLPEKNELTVNARKIQNKWDINIVLEKWKERIEFEEKVREWTLTWEKNWEPYSPFSIEWIKDRATIYWLRYWAGEEKKEDKTNEKNTTAVKDDNQVKEKNKTEKTKKKEKEEKEESFIDSALRKWWEAIDYVNTKRKDIMEELSNFFSGNK